MNHAALDRPWTHDRDFYYQIVEFFGLETRQHAHLRAALDLEHADGIGPLQHLVDLLIFLWHRREIVAATFMYVHEIERLADAGEHAESEHIDLHHPHLVDVVLVPLDKMAILHRRGTDRHELVQTVIGEHEAADMLRKMARKADQLIGKPCRAENRLVGGIEFSLAHLLLAQAAAPASPHTACQIGADIIGKTEHFCDFADRTAWTVVDDGCGQRRAVMA